MGVSKYLHHQKILYPYLATSWKLSHRVPTLVYLPSAVDFIPSQNHVQLQGGCSPRGMFNGTHNPYVGSMNSYITVYPNHHWKILLILLPWQPSHVFSVIIAVSWWWQSEKGVISPHPPLPVCHRPQCSLLRNCQDKWQVWELGSRYQSGIPSHCLLDLECSQTSRTLFLKIGDISDLLSWKLF